MRSSIEALYRDLNEIRDMAGAIAPAGSILAGSDSQQIKRYLSVRRRFDYSAIVIGLYASFEKFVEDLFVLYVEELARGSLYADLPKKLIEKHAKRTAEFIYRDKLDEARYPGATISKLIENLNECLSGNSSYQLNGIAVAAHDGNLRYDELSSMLSTVDISVDQLKTVPAMLAWFRADQRLDPEAKIDLTMTTIRERLNGFVQRRNDVAHRGGNPSDRLDPDGLIELVKFISALSEAIFVLFVSNYLRQKHVNKPSPARLKPTESPKKDGRVWIVTAPEFGLRSGQQVFGMSPTSTAVWGRVVGLQIDGQTYDNVEASQGGEIGIEFTFKTTKGMKIYVVDEEDSGVWLPE